MDAIAEPPRRSLAFGLERAGFLGLGWPRLTLLLVILASALGAWGIARLKVDDSLSELFRTDTEEFRRYEEIDRRFPSSEYDVLAVIEGKNLLQRPQLEALSGALQDLQLIEVG
ncbi:MAG TPA: RND transporter, partial [Hyphomicrobiaceae bacterium]|nr:RND transporter [Hyphomicrobiaceae bacterium]